MLRLVAGGLLAAAIAGCLVSHVTREIPPPGGCDQCHRERIGSDWVLGIAPVPQGEDGGLPDADDIVLRGLRRVPYHRDVPGQRLAVFAAAIPERTVGDQEVGIQCFVCHTSPDTPHQELRGTFRHPWESPRQAAE